MTGRVVVNRGSVVQARSGRHTTRGFPDGADDNAAPRASGGRKTRFNAALTDRVCAALRAGNFIGTACHIAGIGETTFRRWMRKAEADDASPELRAFRRAVKRARAAAEAEALRNIQAAAERGTWQAAAWFLERSAPERWGRRRTSAAESSGPRHEPIRTEEAVEAAMAAFGPVPVTDRGADGNAPRAAT